MDSQLAEVLYLHSEAHNFFSAEQKKNFTKNKNFFTEVKVPFADQRYGVILLFPHSGPRFPPNISMSCKISQKKDCNYQSPIIIRQNSKKQTIWKFFNYYGII